MSSKKPKIIVYSSPSCPFCQMAKAYFEQEGLEFEEIDVSENPEKAKEMVEKSGQTGVPVIEIDDEIIVGFDLPKIQKALKKS